MKAIIYTETEMENLMFIDGGNYVSASDYAAEKGYRLLLLSLEDSIDWKSDRLFIKEIV